MDPAAFVPLGRIVKTHGLAGEVSVIVTDGLPLERLVGVHVWFVPPPGIVRTSVIAGVRPGPKGPLVKLDGIDGPDAAAALRGTTMLAAASDVPADITPEPEDDLVGMRVVDEIRGYLGVIDEVLVTGANDVWLVHGGPFGEVLIPVIEQCVLDIDRDAMSASVRLLPGLIEE
jgi:16S rRNA processing protein RimM